MRTPEPVRAASPSGEGLVVRHRLAENLKNKAIICCERVSDRFTENLKNKAIGCCGRESALALAQPLVEKLTDRYRFAENLKNKAF
ncbi:hypothetical protein [Tolypothrix sp. VBCCA 56010]|uniref:hypothetical protein n=1 Tax=Tolypothrix sp. VBCCA 56010 TaxID=3137731 RepID=UPI003D7E2771